MAAASYTLEQVTNLWCKELSRVSQEIDRETDEVHRSDDGNDDLRAVNEIKQLLRRIRALEIASANVQSHCTALSKRRKELVSSLETTCESNEMLLEELQALKRNALVSVQQQQQQQHG